MVHSKRQSQTLRPTQNCFRNVINFSLFLPQLSHGFVYGENSWHQQTKNGVVLFSNWPSIKMRCQNTPTSDQYDHPFYSKQEKKSFPRYLIGLIVTNQFGSGEHKSSFWSSIFVTFWFTKTTSDGIPRNVWNWFNFLFVSNACFIVEM